MRATQSTKASRIGRAVAGRTASWLISATTINGRPAAHLLYVGRTGDLVGVVIAFSEGETTPGRLANRESVNIVYWREQGYAYAFVGTQPAELLWRMADQTWSSLAPI